MHHRCPPLPPAGEPVPLPGPSARHQVGPEGRQLPEQADGPAGEQDYEHGGPGSVRPAAGQLGHIFDLTVGFCHLLFIMYSHFQTKHLIYQ